jgi:hypothetical protein
LVTEGWTTEQQREGAQYRTKLPYSRLFSGVKQLPGNGKMPLMRLGNTQIACCNRRIYLTALARDRYARESDRTELHRFKAYGESNGE